ncbi:MAG: phage tail protein [Spirochaetes bacterium]|nr:phage tail protein [Spirochaetota bacterium]
MKRIAVFIFFILFASHLHAKVPALINYQGRLKEGTALANGNKNIRFRIFDNLTGGSLIWESQIQVVTATNGIFNTYIGQSDNVGVFSNIKWDQYDTTYLELLVEENSMVPRVQLVSTPYSLMARKVADNAVTTNMIKKGWGLVPAGSIMMWPGSSPPQGWLECDGSAMAKSTYPELYSALKDGGATCIYGDSGGNFSLPDFRGFFVRGWDHGAGMDPDAASRTNRGDTTTGDNVGTKQADQFISHRHPVNYIATSQVTVGAGIREVMYDGVSGTTFSQYEGGNETRPKNINMMFIIKY